MAKSEKLTLEYLWDTVMAGERFETDSDAYLRDRHSLTVKPLTFPAYKNRPRTTKERVALLCKRFIEEMSDGQTNQTSQDKLERQP